LEALSDRLDAGELLIAEFDGQPVDRLEAVPKHC
jgi:hypothetical protein